MDDGQRIGKWEIVGLFVGCAVLILSGTSLYLWDRDEVKITVQIVPFALALNLIASIIWLCGISLKEHKFLVVSLCWWSIPLIFWLIYLILCIVLLNLSDGIDGGYESYDFWTRYNLNVFETIALPITVFAIIFYIAAVVCYIELKKENERFLAEIAQFGILSKEPKQLEA